jgi:hypothetical protein
MGLLLAANNKATRRNEQNNKKLTSIEFKHPAFLNKKQNHRRNGLLPSTDRFLVPENILHTGFTEKGSLQRHQNSASAAFSRNLLEVMKETL